MMRQFFSKLFASPEPADFSRLKTDFHSHLLPGLDDGVQTMEESLEVIEALSRLGYRRLVTTPHVMADRYPNSSKTIAEKCREVRAAIRKAGIPVEFSAAAEYFLDEHFSELLECGDLLTIDEDRHILVELPFHHAPLALRSLLFEMQKKGYKPILAHPERYPYYHNKLAEYQELHDAGCRFQVNILSITGHYGLDVQQAAQLLLKHKLVDYLGTDAHRLRHAQTLSAALRSGHLEKTLQHHNFDNSKL
jgi:tyrosine-protein phosphatase YwqE